MSTAYQLFRQDISKIRRTPKHEADRKRYCNNYIPKSVERLYGFNTNDFAPIEQNREHHFNIMLPILLSLANTARNKYRKCELDDIIQAGTIGALVGIDIYYERSKVELQLAKLSTFVYPYIQKHINEFCWKNTSILSAGTTKWSDAASKVVKSGDDKASANGEMDTTLFELAPSAQLRQYQPDPDEAHELIVLKDKLLCCLSDIERVSLFMLYGIGFDRSYQLREIATHIKRSLGYTHSITTNAISKLRKHAKCNADLVKLLDLVAMNKQNWTV
jgi:DNA-directed RNA polymerase specialized sigma subunit